MDVKIELDRNGLKVDLSFPRIKITSKNKTLFMVSVWCSVRLSSRLGLVQTEVYLLEYFTFSFYFHFTTFWKQLCFLLHYIYLRTLVTCRLFAASQPRKWLSLYLSHILTPHLYFYLSTTVGHFYNTGEFTITAQTTQQLQNITWYCWKVWTELCTVWIVHSNKLCTFPLI